MFPRVDEGEVFAWVIAPDVGYQLYTKCTASNDGGIGGFFDSTLEALELLTAGF